MVERFPDISEHPDNVYVDGDVISWDTTSENGWDARYGIVQPGAEHIFPTPETGERIWLYEPTGSQELEISVIGNDGNVASTHHLHGEGAIVHITGGKDIMVSTPSGQGEIGYMCDYPGVKPDSH